MGTGCTIGADFTTSTDPATFISICLLLVAVTLLACFVPARRATRLHPVQALRVE